MKPLAKINFVFKKIWYWVRYGENWKIHLVLDDVGALRDKVLKETKTEIENDIEKSRLTFF